ncbi:MAG TPA: hypothetical protein V6C88_21435 [Chroococcidiopsis sp.]
MTGRYRFVLLVSALVTALSLNGCQPALHNSAPNAKQSAAAPAAGQSSDQAALSQSAADPAGSAQTADPAEADPDAPSSMAMGAQKVPASQPGVVAILPNGTHYQFCSTPPSPTGEPPTSGSCYVFRKTGDRLFGYYYDTATLGEEGLCISGFINGSTIVGEGIERVGGSGRQEIPPGADGPLPVNWDSDGFLQVSRAKVIDESILDGTQIKYATIRLRLDQFQRYPDTANPVPESCNQ